MKAHCQPKDSASQTVPKEIITPRLVPELNKPVASARSFCGNHIATALIDAGKFAASATPSRKRTITKPRTVCTRPRATDIDDHMTSAAARLTFTPNRSIRRPRIVGKIA